ncbi:MAG: cyclic-di-AMP receptor [Candidatus Saccharibacteria bacterium]
MKLVTAIVNDNHAGAIVDRLVDRGFRVTRLASSGGFLRKGSSTLFTGVEDEEAMLVMKIIKSYVEYQKMRALVDEDEDDYNQAWATVLVMPVEDHVRV